MQISGDKSRERYREIREDSDDEEDVKPVVKAERLSPTENDGQSTDENGVKTLPGLHLTFNLEAGSLLPLAIK